MNLTGPTKQYVTAAVTSAADPTGDTVQMAFTRATDPAAADWQAASWLADTTPPTCATLVDNTTSPPQLDVGTWTVWILIDDNPETPCLRAGVINVS